MTIKPFKIHQLTPDQSKIVQTFLLEHNHNWADGNRSVRFTDRETLVLYDHGYKAGNEISLEIFQRLDGEELTFEQFAKKYNIVTGLTFTKQQMFDFAEFYANNSDAILNDELLKQFLNP